MRNIYRIILGRGNVHFSECQNLGIIGVDYVFDTSLTPFLADTYAESRDLMKSTYMGFNPDKTPVGAGLSCGALWTLGRRMQRGDIVLTPDGKGNYFVGEICGDYQFVPESFFPHQREVKWQISTFPRSEMSEELKRATGATLSLIDVTKFESEIAVLIGHSPIPSPIDPEIEDASAFVLEKHLEDFLIFNWNQTELSRKYDLVTDEGVVVAQQYPSDTGPIDILAISKDKTQFLVIELKKGKTSDVVVGQTLRYMGFVKNQLAVNGETVRGAVIALEDDLRLRNALSMVDSIEFYRYQIDFKLNPVNT